MCFISPEELRVPGYILKEVVIPNGHPLCRRSALMEEVMPELDILYMTRVQRERFFNEEDYVRLKDSYILTKRKMDLAQAGPGRAASPAPGQRDCPRGGRRPPGRLF